MGRLWTEEMQADLERWQAIEEEAANPKDFLISHDINMNDRLRGLARATVAALTYWTLGGDKPLSLRLEIESANIRRQIGPARLKECREWIKANPMEGDPLEGLYFDET
jgi:hypothetical protein